MGFLVIHQTPIKVYGHCISQSSLLNITWNILNPIIILLSNILVKILCRLIVNYEVIPKYLINQDGRQSDMQRVRAEEHV